MKHRHNDPTDRGETATSSESSTEVPLRIVPPADGSDGDGTDGDRDGVEQQILERVTSHIQLARELGIEPLTIDERATAMLDAACDGWRFDRRCREGDRVLDAPHPMCLRAQYHHDVLLLEHGLLDGEGPTDER